MVQKLLNVQNAIIRRLHDEDLSVVQAALSVGLCGIANPTCILRAYEDVLFRCIHIIKGSKYCLSSLIILFIQQLYKLSSVCYFQSMVITIGRVFLMQTADVASDLTVDLV